MTVQSDSTTWSIFSRYDVCNHVHMPKPTCQNAHVDTHTCVFVKTRTCNHCLACAPRTATPVPRMLRCWVPCFSTLALGAERQPTETEVDYQEVDVTTSMGMCMEAHGDHD